MKYRELVVDSIRYWEGKRILYNAVLAILVLAFWGWDILSGGPGDWLIATMVLSYFALIANALYCLAYVADLSMQLTAMQGQWRRYRWLLFAGGTALACVFAVAVMVGPGMA